VENLLLLSIGILFVTLGIGLIYNEYSFRRRAIAVDGRAAGFKLVRVQGIAGESYNQEVVFTCPFTKIKRRVTSTMGRERQLKQAPNSTIKVYVLPEPPHRYRLESPMYLLGNLAIAASVLLLLATYYR
jgi:hypothetical protein